FSLSSFITSLAVIAILFSCRRVRKKRKGTCSREEQSPPRSAKTMPLAGSLLEPCARKAAGIIRRRGRTRPVRCALFCTTPVRVVQLADRSAWVALGVARDKLDQYCLA